MRSRSIGLGVTHRYPLIGFTESSRRVRFDSWKGVGSREKTSLLSARQIMLDLPSITGISVARQGSRRVPAERPQGRPEAKSRSKRTRLLQAAPQPMVATALPANSAAAKSEITVARASGTTSGGPGLESRVHEGEPPTDEHRRGAHARERRSYGARDVTQQEHAGTDQDQRARPETIGDELYGPGPAEHRKTVESDRQTRLPRG